MQNAKNTMSVIATRINTEEKIEKGFLRRSDNHLQLTMKQLVTLFNFSNRMATEITRLFPNENQSRGRFCLERRQSSPTENSRHGDEYPRTCKNNSCM